MSDDPSQGTDRCLSCGAQFPAFGARFCPLCGRVIGAPQATSWTPPVTPALPPSPAAQTPPPLPTPPIPAYSQPPAHQQLQGYGPVPGYPAPYGYAPPRARRNSGPIFAGLAAFVLILVVVGASVLAALRGAGSTPAPSGAATQVAAGSATAAAPTPKKTYTYSDMVVGFIQTGNEPGWHAANTTSYQEAATADGITLKTYFSNNNFDNQITAFNQFIADPQVNVIVLAAVASSGYDDVLKAAQAAGKIVIVEDRPIDSGESLYYTRVGSDYEGQGQKSAAAMCDLLKGMSGANVVEIGGDVSHPAAHDRAKGFREKMGDCGITITASSNAANWDPQVAKPIMEADLKASKDIQGVFAHNDGLAIAAIQAIDEAGLKAGTDIKVVGIDATADGFKYMISGELGADIECNPLVAPHVYEAALRGLNGDTTTPKWIATADGEFFASQGAAALKAILATRKY